MKSLEIYSTIEELKSDRSPDNKVSKETMRRRKKAVAELNKKFSASLLRK